jgi:hypothetical protein
MDDVPPVNFADRVPELEGFNTLKGLGDFLNNRGFTGNDYTNLHRELQLKIAREALGELSPEDAKLMTDAKTNQKTWREKTGREKLKDFKDLDRYAKNNGFRVSEAGSGRYAIRTLDDNRVLAGADNMDAAKAWIDKAGQANGPDLDGKGTSIDNNIAAGGMSPPPSDPPKTPFDNPYDFVDNQARIGKYETVARFLDNGALWTRYHDFMSHLDGKYGTQFLTKIHETLNQTRNIRNSRAKPWIQEWETLRRSFKGNEADAMKIMQYIETMSPEEVINKFMKRPMNGEEIRTARSIAESKVDLEKVFNYRNEAEKIDRKYNDRFNNPDQQLKYEAEMRATKNAYQMDDKALEVANVMNQIEEQPKNLMSLGAVVRLARSIDNGLGERELTRVEFAKKHGLAPEILSQASRIEDLYNRLAQAFQINSDRQLGGYATHARMFYQGDIPKATKYFSGDVKTTDFFAKLSRTGEISAFETNAHRGLLRYIKAGFDVQSGFTDALKNARSNLEKELLRLPADAQGKARNVIGRYIDDMQGTPEAGDRASREAIRYMNEKFGWNLDEATGKNWTTVLNSLVNAGALGARPMLGIGHFGISSVISTILRDGKYTAKMLANGAKAVFNDDVSTNCRLKEYFKG